MRILLLLLLPAAIGADSGLRGFPSSAVAQHRALEEKPRSIPDPARLREYMQRMTEEPHHAGSPGSKVVAEYALSLFRSWGLEAAIEEYEALLPAPKSRRLEMLAPVKFVAKLQEPRIAEDKDSGDAGQLPTYNAYSASGDVTGPLVYVNFGMPEDYEHLAKEGIDVKGKIVLTRYGGGWRGLKPKLAAQNGAIGCLIYSDPNQDGYFAGDVYPKGPFRPRDGVQRGSVMDMSLYPGDPLSPGWASEKGSKRLTLDETRTLQKIPVLPISYADAQPLLEKLEGPVAPEKWRGSLPLTYHIGPGPAKVRLAVDIDQATRPVYNVIARIRGSEFPSQWVIYGNHHDAWVNGASDPVSGAAPLLETARALGELSKQGWKPKRSVIFALWDAEEFGLIGSTEWVEKHAADLDRNAVVYFNSDMNTSGKLGVGGSHTLEQFMSEVARDLKDPESGKTLFDLALAEREKESKKADFRVGALGSGSDYTAFLHHAGIASLNLGFSDRRAGGVYHSIYDSFDWFTRFADPKFTYSRAFSQIMITAVLRFADAPLVPFEFTRLAATAGEYVDELKKLKGAASLRLDPVSAEIKQLQDAAATLEARYKEVSEKAEPAARLAAANELLYRTERSLLSPAGLPGRDWFKHSMYAPGMLTGYAAKTLPGIREAAEGARWDEANQQAEIAAARLRAVRTQLAAAEKALAGL